MKTLEDHLSQYAAYHRNSRNIATHFIGIPLIVLAINVLLSRPVVGGPTDVPLSPAVVTSLVSAMYYLRLDVRFGIVMTALLGLSIWFGAWASAQPTALWLGLGTGGFVVGWVFQFVGHAWEGRKPAFVDDVMGLVIGPLFVVAEAAFLLGMRASLKRAVETRAGKIRRGTSTRAGGAPT